MSGAHKDENALIKSQQRICARLVTLKAFEDNHWNKSAAARQLGIGRDHLRYRLKKYGIKRPGT